MQPRDELVTSRLTRPERGLLDAVALVEGLSRSETVRRLVVRAARERLAELSKPERVGE